LQKEDRLVVGMNPKLLTSTVMHTEGDFPVAGRCWIAVFVELERFRVSKFFS